MSLRNWLPTSQEMSNAAQMRQGSYRTATMQQAMGMIVLTALLAGLLPFISNLILGIRYETVLPLAQAARNSAALQEVFGRVPTGFPGINHAAITDFYLTAAGLDQALPVWLAAGLSALGEWLSWPLRWLTFWIVYGALVMVATVALGATMTLQRFYAATGYAAVPLLLTGLSAIPCIGPVVTVIGVIWALGVYVRATEEIARLPRLRAVASVLMPAALMLLLVLVAFGIGLTTLLVIL